MRRGPAPAASGALLLGAVLLVSLNLRGAIAAVSPVLPQIRGDLSMSAAAAGLLTTLPVLCFAAGAPVAAWLARRAGLETAVLTGCLAIAAGTLLRVMAGVPLLLAGTLVVGVGMAVGNVVVPVVVKRDFPRRVGATTGLYTAALAAGAALSAALTAPVAALWGWRTGLAVWAALAVAAAAVWTHATRRRKAGDPVPGAPREEERERVGTGLWRSPVAWAIALFLGCQSFEYYSVTAWLPTLLVDDAGLGVPAAGVGMSLFQALGIAGSLVVPLVATRLPRQGWLGVLVAAGWATLHVGLLTWPSAWVLWAVVGGVTQGGGVAFAFTVLVLRAADTATARALSGMVQFVGYSIAATGPVAIGALYEVAGGWGVPLVLLLTVTGVQASAGLVAGRDATVGGHRSEVEAGRT